MKKTIFTLSCFLMISLSVKSQSCFTFTQPVGSPFTSATNPKSIVSDDLDGDGDKDLAVVNQGSGNVSVFLNNGNGTFAPLVNYTTGGSPTFISVADLNGDTKLDLAVTHSAGLSVLVNNGSGTFTTTINSTGFFATRILHTPQDLDGDGDKDLALARYALQDTLFILKNNGSGSFTKFVQYPIASFSPYIESSDVENDGDFDLVVSTYSSDGNVRLFKNNGNATFASAITYSVGPNLYDVRFADVDNDADKDLIVVNAGGGKIAVLKNNGIGVFATPIQYSAGTGSFPEALVVADFDSDGDNDLAFTDQPASKVAIVLNNGSGVYSNLTSYTTGANTFPFSLTSNDLNGDTNPDMGVVNSATGNFVLLFNNSLINLNVNTTGSTLTSLAAGATYQWKNCATGLSIPGATNQSYTAVSNGTYAVVVTMGACTGTSTCIVVNSITTGMKENTQSENSISVYPNPAKDYIMLKANQKLSVSVYNSIGQILFNKDIDNGNNKIDLSDFTKGIYFITTNKQSKAINFVITE